MALFSLDDPEYALAYAREAAMVDAAELIADALEKSGLSRADLARALGVRPSEITARLRGERNITVRSLAETLHALGQRLDLRSSPTPSLAAHSAYEAWTVDSEESTTSVSHSDVADYAALRVGR